MQHLNPRFWLVTLLLSCSLLARATTEFANKPTLFSDFPPITSTQLNTSVSGGWSCSGDYRGWGGAFRTGVLLNEHHGVEVEINYFQLINNTTKFSQPTVVVANLSRYAGVTSRSVIDELPLLINYRYQWGCAIYPVNFYAGLGLGVNIFSCKSNMSIQQYTISDGEITLGLKQTSDTNFTKLHPIGQVFAGVGVSLTKNFNLLVGGRLLASQSINTNEPSIQGSQFSTIASTDTLQTIIEATLLFTW